VSAAATARSPKCCRSDLDASGATSHTTNPDRPHRTSRPLDCERCPGRPHADPDTSLDRNRLPPEVPGPGRRVNPDCDDGTARSSEGDRQRVQGVADEGERSVPSGAADKYISVS
jgi:hypothetical protein